MRRGWADEVTEGFPSAVSWLRLRIHQDVFSIIQSQGTNPLVIVNLHGTTGGNMPNTDVKGPFAIKIWRKSLQWYKITIAYNGEARGSLSVPRNGLGLSNLGHIQVVPPACAQCTGRFQRASPSSSSLVRERVGYWHCKLPLVEPGIDYCIPDLSELRKTFILKSYLDI